MKKIIFVYIPNISQAFLNFYENIDDIFVRFTEASKQLGTFQNFTKTLKIET